MGRFSKVGTSNFNSGGQYAKLGNHVVRIDAYKVIQTREDGEVLICEYTYIASDNPAAEVGKSSSEYMKLSHASTPGNQCQFQAVALTVFMREKGKMTADQVVTPDMFDGEKGEALSEWMVAPNNPMGGLVLGLLNEMNAKGTFTKHWWMTSAEMVAKMTEIANLSAQIKLPTAAPQAAPVAAPPAAPLPVPAQAAPKPPAAPSPGNASALLNQLAGAPPAPPAAPSGPPAPPAAPSGPPAPPSGMPPGF